LGVYVAGVVIFLLSK